MVNDIDLSTTLRQLRRTLPQLARLPRGVKDRALQTMSDRLRDQADQILEANTLDLENCRSQQMPTWVLEGMKLTPERILKTTQQMESLAYLPDPVGRIDQSWHTEQGTLVNRYRVPLGLVALVYEIYPEFAISGLSMAVKSGNGMVLSCNASLQNTHLALVNLLSEAAYSEGLPEGSLQSFSETEEIPFQAGISPTLPLLQQARFLDLVIPCGRPSWVESVAEASAVPVLQTRLGYGHVYIDQGAGWESVQAMVLQSLSQPLFESTALLQPITLWWLIHKAWADRYLVDLITELTHRGCLLQVDQAIQQQFPHLPAIAELIDSGAQSHLRLQLIPSLPEAITWINKNGFRHSEAIYSDSHSAIQRFIQEVDAASICVNSPLFSSPSGLGIPALEGGLGLSLGTSVQKLHARGPITLEALTTIKFVETGLPS